MNNAHKGKGVVCHKTKTIMTEIKHISMLLPLFSPLFGSHSLYSSQKNHGCLPTNYHWQGEVLQV